MKISPVRNDRELRVALAAISELLDQNPKPGSEESDYLDVLITLVEAYEQKTVPIGPPEPIEAIRFRMDQGGLAPRTLFPSLATPTGSTRSSTARVH